MPTARSDRFAPLERLAEAQFGGFATGLDIGGFGGIAPGSGFGFGVPARGGPIPGGSLFAGGGSGIGPVLTLESVFGSGFTDESIADAIRVAEQAGRFTTEGPVTGAIEVATGPLLSLVLNVASGLFEFLNRAGQRVAGGTTVRAAERALMDSGLTAADLAEVQAPAPAGFPPTLEAVTTAPFVAPPPPPQQDPNLFGAIQALISILRGPFTFEELMRGPPRRQPAPSDFPIDFPPGRTDPDIFGFPRGTFPDFERIGPGIEQIRPQQIEQVLPGGTVNVPVVLGSTGDPTGVRRPRFPNEEQLTRAQQIGRIIRDLLALRRARQNADKQRRAFEQFLAARLEILRGGQQMPFGQSGFAVGGLGGGAIGALTDLAISAGGAFLADRFGPAALPGLPAFPAAPVQGPLLGVGGGGGGGCPPLFRAGAPAGFRMSPVPWFPVQAPNGKWFFFGHLGAPSFSKLKARRRHHHHSRKR